MLTTPEVEAARQIDIDTVPEDEAAEAMRSAMLSLVPQVKEANPEYDDNDAIVHLGLAVAIDEVRAMGPFGPRGLDAALALTHTAAGVARLVLDIPQDDTDHPVFRKISEKVADLFTRANMVAAEAPAEG